MTAYVEEAKKRYKREFIGSIIAKGNVIHLPANATRQLINKMCAREN